jgi:hypothetical protein
MRRPSKVHAARTLSVQVQANELNVWADRSGGDEDMGGDEQGFELDTAAIISRVLTAKAVQHILNQLGETDRIVCQWFNNFVAENSPMKGDAFVLKLMQQVRLSAGNITTALG